MILKRNGSDVICQASLNIQKMSESPEPPR
jgi:hypothetical protein